MVVKAWGIERYSKQLEYMEILWKNDDALTGTKQELYTHFSRANKRCSINILTFEFPYLHELVNLHLSVLVEVHLIKDFMECVFIYLDIDALRRRVKQDVGSITCNEDQTTNKKKALKEDSLPKPAGRPQWWWTLCSLCQTYGNASCT